MAGEHEHGLAHVGGRRIPGYRGFSADLVRREDDGGVELFGEQSIVCVVNDVEVRLERGQGGHSEISNWEKCCAVLPPPVPSLPCKSLATPLSNKGRDQESNASFVMK